MSETVVNSGTLIAAVGNIEAKAASYLAMPADVAVSPWGLKTIVEDLQQPDNVRAASVNVYGNYCSASYAQVGLVVKEYVGDAGRLRYRSTRDEHGLAIAGAMLDWSIPLDLSLRQLWASTGTPNKAKVSPQEASRGTHGRLGIFATLAAHDGVLTNGFIVKQKQLEHRSVSLHLKDLARLGVVDYVALDSKGIDPLYSVNTPENTQNAAQARLVDILIAAGDPLPRSELISRLGHYASKRTAQTAMHMLTRRMVENGSITVVNGVKRDEFSEVTLKPEWREAIQDLVARVTAIEQGESATIEGWKSRGEEILHEPPLLTQLMYKSFNASGVSQARSGTRPSIGELVKSHLTQHGPSTSEEIIKALGEDINVRSVYSALHDLRRKRTIVHPTESQEQWAVRV